MLTAVIWVLLILGVFKAIELPKQLYCLLNPDARKKLKAGDRGGGVYRGTDRDGNTIIDCCGDNNE